MNLPVTKKLGLTSRADMIDLLCSGNAVFGKETVWALGFEFQQTFSDGDAPKMVVASNKEPKAVEQESSWTQFEPGPTQYWRVTGYEALHQKSGKQKRSDRRKKTKKLPDLDDIQKGFNFSLENILKRLPLAEMNYITTQLRKAAGIGRSRHELDLTAAVDRLSRGQFLYRMPYRARRVWGHDLLCLEDRAQRLVPYWSDQDDVTSGLAKLYPKTGYTVARLGNGRTILRVQSPDSLYGLECPMPSPGTLVLALTDLGSLAIREDGPQVREYWTNLGRLYLENGNRAVAMIPCLPEQVPTEVARYWHIIPWERPISETVIGDQALGLERLLTILSVAVRLEPELLRAVRKLIPETRDNPGVESLVWQHDFVSSPNSVAADLSAAERKKRIDGFEREPIEVREKVLELIRAVRQIGYEDVWVSELLGLDAESQERFLDDVTRAEQQILSLASAGSKERLDDYAVWLERLDEQLTRVPRMKSEVREALSKLVKRVAAAHVSRLSVWMPERIVSDPKLPIHIVEVRQRGSVLHFERNLGSDSRTIPAASAGSLLAQIKTRSDEVRIHEVQHQRELSETQFWADGRKPAWVHRFGVDEYGPWCSFRVNKVEQVLRWIPSGDFLMGSPTNEEGRFDAEGPQHRVKISRGFWMFETPCTQELWFAVMGTDLSHFKGEKRPVESVSWDDASEFGDAINRLFPGIGIHLPSEAQWEYSCRGPNADQNPQKSRYGKLEEIAWWAGNSGAKTHDVAQKQCNGFGLYDMLGNVWEWCRDHAYRKYDETSRTDPLYELRDAFSLRVVRGGCWRSSEGSVRAAYRNTCDPSYRIDLLGFRCLSSPEPGAEPSREAAMSGSKSLRGGSPQDGVSELPPRGKNLKSGFGVLGRSTSASSHRDSEVSYSSRMLQLRSNFTHARISRLETRVLQLETDCEILSLELAPPPPWAVASGRDRYGLWAEFELSGVRQRLRWIPPGEFLMGSGNKPQESLSTEQPQHPVIISRGFWLFDTPCTQELWMAVGMPPICRFSGKYLPVDGVSWKQANDFIEKINSVIDGITLRLPTEAEWEYSCRAGTSGDRYGDLNNIAWYANNSGEKTHVVKGKLANAWGLYDMLGNVWEWCLDGLRKYSSESVKDPFGGDISNRVFRGGSWRRSERRVRAANRRARVSSYRYDDLGFRCLSSPEPTPEQNREAAESDDESVRGGSPQDAESF